MGNDRPEYLYRGMRIRYDELKDFVFSGIDMELPYEPYIDGQGRETVRDGNEYGIYMSDNPKVAEYTYGNATNNPDDTYIEPRIMIGNRGNEFIKIPAIGICYKISTQGLDIRKPWINSILQCVYNNGLTGDEWITDKIPAENYEIMSVQIGKDLLHDEQYLNLSDIENIKEKTTQILEQRKKRLEIFAQEMSKIPEQQRKDFGLGHLEVLKEIYGENGFYYMESMDEIDSSSNVGMIRYLMANVYKNDTESIDFSELLYLQDIKEKAEFMQKKGKNFDLKEYLSNDLENIAHKEKMLEIIKQKENEKSNTIVVKQGQNQDDNKKHNKNEVSQNYVEEKDEIKDDLVDYYEQYGIDKDEKWETIKEKLKKEQRKWMKRSSSTNEKKVLDEVFQRIDEISEVLELFKPENKEKRNQYDAKLEQQKRRQVINNDIKEGVIIENNRIGLESIAASIKSKPTSLEHLQEIQQQIASQIKAREKGKDSIQLNTEKSTQIDNIEK